MLVGFPNHDRRATSCAAPSFRGVSPTPNFISVRRIWNRTICSSPRPAGNSIPSCGFRAVRQLREVAVSLLPFKTRVTKSTAALPDVITLIQVYRTGFQIAERPHLAMCDILSQFLPIELALEVFRRTSTYFLMSLSILGNPANTWAGICTPHSFRHGFRIPAPPLRFGSLHSSPTQRHVTYSVTM